MSRIDELRELRDRIDDSRVEVEYAYYYARHFDSDLAEKLKYIVDDLCDLSGLVNAMEIELVDAQTLTIVKAEPTNG